MQTDRNLRMQILFTTVCLVGKLLSVQQWPYIENLSEYSIQLLSTDGVTEGKGEKPSGLKPY